MRALFVPICLVVSLAAVSLTEADPVLPAPLSDRDFYPRASAAKFELGRMLFFDKVLSGNRNISCATCHHPTLASADGVALGFGEGAVGLGPKRRSGNDIRTGVHERVPRNAPALFNLGALEYTRMFHDGRVEVDSEGHYAGGFITPAKWKLPEGLENVLAAQAMFPVTSPTEMAGQQGENEVADAKALNRAAGPHGVWELLARRLRAIPDYVRLFRAAYPGRVQKAADVDFVLAANALAAFEADAFRAVDSPFDRYLRGEHEALTPHQQRGLALFYGKANCSSCHSGPLQTDHDFHAIAMPQIGPGKNDGRDGAYWRASGERAFLEDFGRGRVTYREHDNHRFRTPSLRNVELTGPWGHAGSYDSLDAAVRHHLDPVGSLERYRPSPTLLPPMPRVLELSASGDRLEMEWLVGPRLSGFRQRDDFVQRTKTLRERVAAANELAPVALDDDEIATLVAFLQSLTDPASRKLVHLVPEAVPSGLPVED